MRKMKVLTTQSINQNVSRMEYAVRGELAIRAEEIRQVALYLMIEIGRA